MKRGKEAFIKNESLLKKHKVSNPRNYKWCSYCKTFHLKSAFYHNSYNSDGFQCECKVVSRLRTYNINYKEALETFSKEEQKIFKCCR